MRNNNINGALPFGAKVRTRKISEIWNAYDGLPRGLKELYDSLPVKCDSVQIAELYKKFGSPATEQIIVQFMQENFPSWSPRQND